eukprot:5254403-Prymnesium_polylepis.1
MEGVRAARGLLGGLEGERSTRRWVRGENATLRQQASHPRGRVRTAKVRCDRRPRACRGMLRGLSECERGSRAGGPALDISF